MKLRNFYLTDFEELVNMYYDFTVEIYPHRKISPKYFFYKAVGEWINSRKDIILAVKDDIIVGFTLAYKDDNGGVTEPIYFGEIAYIKPEYRKTRAAYLMYHNIVSYATEQKLILVANGLATTGVSKMIKKHFDCKEMFVNFEKEIK